MNAITLLPYALPVLGLAMAGMLRFARWLDQVSPAAQERRYARLWHSAVVAHERASGHYVHDGSITDIKPITFM